MSLHMVRVFELVKSLYVDQPGPEITPAVQCQICGDFYFILTFAEPDGGAFSIYYELPPELCLASCSEAAYRVPPEVRHLIVHARRSDMPAEHMRKALTFCEHWNADVGYAPTGHILYRAGRSFNEAELSAEWLCPLEESVTDGFLRWVIPVVTEEMLKFFREAGRKGL